METHFGSLVLFITGMYGLVLVLAIVPACLAVCLVRYVYARRLETNLKKHLSRLERLGSDSVNPAASPRLRKNPFEVFAMYPGKFGTIKFQISNDTKFA